MTSEQFSQCADDLLRRIDNELAIAVAHRRTGANDGDLQFASNYVKEMKRAVVEGPLPAKTLRHPELSRMVLDHWVLPSELGSKLTELETWYTGL
jgi:hypothetical protein